VGWGGGGGGGALVPPQVVAHKSVLALNVFAILYLRPELFAVPSTP
jgi:hypothetical protein